jgi:hypothetical protein
LEVDHRFFSTLLAALVAVEFGNAGIHDRACGSPTTSASLFLRGISPAPQSAGFSQVAFGGRSRDPENFRDPRDTAACCETRWIHVPERKDKARTFGRVVMGRAISIGLAAMMFLGMPGSLVAAAAAGALSGTLSDAGGGRLSNANVRVRDASRASVVLETRTGAAGQFSALTIRPGIYIVEVLDSSGQVIGVSRTVPVIAGETSTVALTAAAAQAPRTLSQAGFSIFGLGQAASIGVAAAAVTAAAETTVAVATRPNPSPSQ